MPKIAVPIDSELIGELFLRRGPEADVSAWIEDVLENYLERTADEGEWEKAFYQWREQSAGARDFAEEYGDSKEGLLWAPVFLPNGTSVRMEYRKEAQTAVVKFGKLHYKGQTYSPSELARVIANGTNRNAWRDLWIKRPGEKEWALADELRRKAMGA